jgi:hypothetical protein
MWVTVIRVVLLLTVMLVIPASAQPAAPSRGLGSGASAPNRQPDLAGGAGLIRMAAPGGAAASEAGKAASPEPERRSDAAAEPHTTIDEILGAAFVLWFAAQRFNTPRTNRSSTTAVRYYTAAIFYCLFGLALYSMLVGFPDLLRQALAAAGTVIPPWTQQLSSPLLVALLLTVLLPTLPVLGAVDDWIRKTFQGMASIPLEAQLLSAQLQRARFHASRETRTEVAAKLGLDGFAPDDILFEPSEAPQHLWTRIAVLVTHLEAWKSRRKFIGFVLDFAADFGAIEAGVRPLAFKARKLFELQRTLAAGGEGAAALAPYRADFEAQARELHAKICDFVSRGVLQCELTDGARTRELQRLGFQARIARPRLTLNQLLSLFLGILAVAVISFAFMPVQPGQDIHLEHVLARAALIAAIYVVAVCCAVLPKRRWGFARRGPRGVRPVLFYVVAALMAAAGSRLVGLAFAVYLDPRTAWPTFWQSRPWVLMSMLTAAATAFAVDNQSSGILTRERLRWLEGFGQALATLLTTWVVYWWLYSLAPPRYIPTIPQLLLPMVIGFGIGVFVPTWYREAPHRVERRLGERRQYGSGHVPERRGVDRRAGAEVVDLRPRPPETAALGR